jgi:vancomycin resistance protein YoaR
MAAEEIDLVDEILGAGAAANWKAPAPEKTTPEAPEASAPEAAESTAPVDEPASDELERRLMRQPRPQIQLLEEVSPRPRIRPQLHVHNPFSRAYFGGRRVRRVVGFAFAFTLGAFATLALLVAVVVGVTSAYSNRVVPGVHVGAIYLSGLSRDQVVARLETAYAYLGQGDVVVTTPAGSSTLTYQQLGRGPDVQFMADEAMSVGHTGNRIGDAVTMLRTSTGSWSVPVVARIDPTAVATTVRQLAAHDVLPQDARAWRLGTGFTYSNATIGSGIDEKAVSSAIVDRLSQSNAPATFRAGGALLKLEPQVSDADAQAAIRAGQKMVVNITLEFGGENPGLSSSEAAIPRSSVAIDSQTVLGWIVFQTGSDGRYGPAVDPGRVEADLSRLCQKFVFAPVEPTIVFGGAGMPMTTEGGRDGEAIDAHATAQGLAAYLDELAAGATQSNDIAVATKSVPPNLSVASLSSLVEIGGWQTTFYPDVSNGYGANIRVPATLLNGQIVEPGQRFSFLSAVSPIDEAHGYTLGGVIEQGKSDHTGAMGGGICSASTTMFNAAARAGLEIDERHPHYYYITRYPVGLDATVFTNGYQVWDLQWTNDTPNPIVIVSSATYGSASTITIQLWSQPLNRKVTFSPEFKANVVSAGDYTQYSTSLPVGQETRAEYPTDGFDTSRTRTVTDSTGRVIHTDTWDSHYSMVNGLLVVGAAPARAPAPLPGAPQPAVLPAPPAPAIASRRSIGRRALSR